MGENSSRLIVLIFCSKSPVDEPFLAASGGTYLRYQPAVNTIIESWYGGEYSRMQLLAVLDQSRRVSREKADSNLEKHGKTKQDLLERVRVWQI